MLVDFTETQRLLQQTMRRLARQEMATRRGAWIKRHATMTTTAAVV